MSEVLRHAKYRRRTTIVEPCFGELKERHGLKRFRASVDCKLFAPNLPRDCIAFNLKKVVGHTAVLMICILIPVASARRRDQFLILATVPRQPKSPRSTSFIDSLDTRTDTVHVSSASWPPFHSPFRHCPRNRRIRWAVAGHHCGIVRRRPGGRCNDDPNDGGGWPDAQLLRLASMYTAAEYTVAKACS